MTKQYFIGILTCLGLPTIAKYCLDFVIDHVSAKFQQFVAPVLGGIIGGVYGGITSGWDPQATVNMAQTGISLGVATIAAHMILPDVIKVAPTPPAK